MLFISYVHDAPSCIFPKFADDLAGLVSAADIVTVEESLQSVLSQLNSWSEEWELQLSTSKTKVMLFGSQQEALEGVKIEQVESMKYLGVWLDTHLTFLQQAEYAASKA